MIRIALLLAISVCSFTFSAQYVIESAVAPNLQNRGAIKRQITFDQKTFWVVESERSLNQLKSQSLNIQKDLRIEVVPTFSNSVVAEAAWHVKQLNYKQLTKSVDGKNVVVAVLDTGIDFTHSALKNHLWTNPKEIAGNEKDDDLNGYADDVHGYNFDGHSSDIMDTHSHGTHCGGLIVADENLQSKAQGVAQGAKIMAVKIIDQGVDSFLSGAAEGIKYAVDNGAKVLSNSWRVYKDWTEYVTEENVAILKAAIEYAEKRGVLFIAAAGNESKDINDETNPIYPVGLALSNILGVAAYDSELKPTSFTNFGAKFVQVTAPGQDIISTIPGEEWASFSGTSMATPIVAGAAARGLGKGLSMKAVIDNLMKTSDVMDEWKEKVTADGIINLVKFLN